MMYHESIYFNQESILRRGMNETFNQPTDLTCVHSCLALITGNSVQYVIDWFKESGDRALYSEDTIIFLAHHGTYLSCFVEAEERECLDIHKETTLNIQWPVEDRLALLSVKSERFEGMLHCVFWDGEKVLDPNPNVNRFRKLEEYNIMEFWPLLATEEVYKRFPVKYGDECKI